MTLMFSITPIINDYLTFFIVFIFIIIAKTKKISTILFGFFHIVLISLFTFLFFKRKI